MTYLVVAIICFVVSMCLFGYIGILIHESSVTAEEEEGK
jgi:hypothetical protein